MASQLERLSVVMPVYNEDAWVERAIRALEESSDLAGLEVDVIVVDDGSTGPTVGILDELERAGRIRLIRQQNAGRFAARAAGLRSVETSHVLLLDARVLLHPGSVTYLAQAAAEDGCGYNAHVDVVSVGNPFAAFWSGITKIGWRRYFSNPRHVQYGAKDFNFYPKGTGAFLSPTDVLRDASRAFHSLYSDPRFASDDTRLLREIASSVGIVIDPRFRVDYYGRDSLDRWLSQVYFRGTTFVDGYLGRRGRAVPAFVALSGCAGVGVALMVKAPRRVSATLLMMALGSAVATRRSGGTARESVAVAGLILPFSIVFGAGVARGLMMAARR